MKVRMSALQRAVYDHVEKHRRNPFDNSYLYNAQMQMRKIANHPFLLMQDGWRYDQLMCTSGKAAA